MGPRPRRLGVWVYRPEEKGYLSERRAAQRDPDALVRRRGLRCWKDPVSGRRGGESLGRNLLPNVVLADTSTGWNGRLNTGVARSDAATHCNPEPYLRVGRSHRQSNTICPAPQLLRHQPLRGWPVPMFAALYGRGVGDKDTLRLKRVRTLSAEIVDGFVDSPEGLKR